MKGYELLFLSLATFLFANIANAQYWFQFGARGGGDITYNYGAGVEIQTIFQNVSDGSLGFWVGETLSNGAFLQVGYVIENQSGDYPSYCDFNGCSKYEYLQAGQAEWFYEYFLPNKNSGFLGALGPAGSAGANGTFNTYSFYSIGNTWYFTFNGNVIGSADLGASNSGPYTPVAFGELANTSINTEYIHPVIFRNLSVYVGGVKTKVPKGYSYIGYGVGSATGLYNPYGVKEVDSKVNYFGVGSGLTHPQNNTQLWSQGYNLVIKSQYSNISSSTGYLALSNIRISAPEIVQINSTARALFLGWKGSGTGSYTGPLNNVTILMGSNITETATWKTEYYINISSQYGSTTGSGWYSLGDNITYSINSTTFYTGSGTREIFMGWDNSNRNTTGMLTVKLPAKINAIWQKQYLLNVSSEFGNVTGSGWYPNDTIATVLIRFTNVTVSPEERYSFIGWSNGNNNSSMQILVIGPTTIKAIFAKQYLIHFITENMYGSPINVTDLYLDGRPISNSTFLNAGRSYNITGAVYDGVQLSFKDSVTAYAPSNVSIKLPVYNVTISSTDIFGLPVTPIYSITTSNGSSQTLSSNNGTITIENVPYGYIKGSATYLGITQNFVTRGGAGVRLVFVSLLDILAFCMVAVAIFAAYLISKHHYAKQTYTVQGQNR